MRTGVLSQRNARRSTKPNDELKPVNITVAVFDIRNVVVQNMMSPLRSELVLAICRGWRTSPTTRSVVEKQASAMLDLVRSCGLVFTATITRMLSTMIKGQVRAFTTILAINTARTSKEMFAGFTGESEKPHLGKLCWIYYSSSLVKSWEIALQGTWTGFAHFHHFPLISSNALIAGSRFYELYLHLHHFISKWKYSCICQDGLSESSIKIEQNLT